MRKILSVCLVCLLSFGLVFSVLAGERSKKSYRIAMAIYNLSPEYMQTWHKEALNHPAVASGLVKLTTYNGDGSHITQLDQFNSIATLKYDAVILIPSDFISGDLLVHTAVRSGIPVIGSCGPVRSNELVSYIGSDEVEAGHLIATTVIDKMGGKGNVVILKGPVDMGGTIRRSIGIEKALLENPEIRVLDEKSANWLRDDAYLQMKQWLIAFENRIDGVIAQNDEMALGAIRAIKEAGEQILPTAGIDGIPDAVTAVKNGEMLLTLHQDAMTEAQGAIDLTLRHLIGPSYEPQSSCWNKYQNLDWNDGTDMFYPVPWTVYTAESLK